MTEDLKKIIKKITEELFEKMDSPNIKIDISQEEEVSKISLETDEENILIGYHGETLSAIQLLLSLFIYKKEGKWRKILVDVGDYRKKREGELKELALKAAQRVKFSGKAIGLSGLSSFERRAVHLVLKEDPEIETHSEGEGGNRILIVSPKQKKSQSNQIDTDDK